jgi:nucleotide-binding universal stress UspA family protein
VAVLDSPEIRSSVIPAIGPYYPMMLDAVQAKLKHADQILNESLDRFSQICSAEGVSHLETEYEGIPAQTLLQSSIFYDLLVIGLETSFHFETRGGTGDTLDKLLDRTATPVLAVPSTGMDLPKKVTIAFDGSFGSSRALRDFMIFGLPFQPEITIVTAGLDPEKSSFLLEKAKSLLHSHGFDQVETRASEESVEKTFTDGLVEDSDLIVAGIHSRRRFKDIFVGSFTKHLIKECNTALFLSH